MKRFRKLTSDQAQSLREAMNRFVQQKLERQASRIESATYAGANRFFSKPE